MALSLLLVVSLSFSLTRAWFLRVGTAVEHTIDFGYISTLTESGTTSVNLEHLVPGDTLTGLEDYTVAYSADVSTSIYLVFSAETEIAGLTMLEIFGEDVTAGEAWEALEVADGYKLADGKTGIVYKIANTITEKGALKQYNFTIDMPIKVDEDLTLEDVYPENEDHEIEDHDGVDVTITIQVGVIQADNVAYDTPELSGDTAALYALGFIVANA